MEINVTRLHYSIGISNFGEIRQKDLIFVDKTLFIRDILDEKGTKVMVFTRPRRFGKTLNLSMLHHFLASEVIGIKTHDIFGDLNIAQTGHKYMQHQGHYPVIFITLKDVKDHTYEHALINLRILLSRLYDEHNYLLISDKISDQQKIKYSQILREECDEGHLKNALLDLCHMIYLHTGVRPWLLIDEYDTPIQASYVGESYPEVIGLMRGFYGSALKDNPYLEKAVMTGILRVAKESLFSGVNNLEVYSMLRPEYGEYFGFTESEIDELLKKSQLTDQSPEIKYWYNGYLMGNTTIYNPWSIVNCLKQQGDFKAYWINTSDNALIKKLFWQASIDTKNKLEQLIRGEAIEALIAENTVFGELETNSNAIWSLLLFSGYLKVVSSVPSDMGSLCQLLSPNYEVSLLYRGMVASWFVDSMGYDEYRNLLKELTTGNIEIFEKILQKYLLESMSYFDVTGKQPERFYHGFVMGLLVSLRETHQIKSNRESGYGRYDISIIPNDKNQLGLIIEFKTTEENEDLNGAVQSALKQIEYRDYAAELTQLGIKNILKIGMAFKGKQVKILQEKN